MEWPPDYTPLPRTDYEPPDSPYILPRPLPETKEKHHQKIIDALTPMTQYQRADRFRENFINDVQSLITLGNLTHHPDIMETYKPFQPEIWEAYLANTLFTTRVDLPYDMATKKFDPRFGAGSGGTIEVLCDRISPDIDELLYTAEFNRIRFDIGNSFGGVLCSLTLELTQTRDFWTEMLVDERIKATASEVCAGHDLLLEHLRVVARRIETGRIEGSHFGFSLETLETIAVLLMPPVVD